MTQEHESFVVKGFTISPELLDKGFPAGGGPCRCSSECCSGGVCADVGERDRILALKETIKKYMDETQNTDTTTWFETEESVDEDFRSGRCVGTAVFNDKCVFLNAVGQCSLQLAAVAEGKHKWDLKPLYCVLYPVEVAGGVVSFDPMLQGDEACCSVTEQFDVPLFVACREELEFLLGSDGYEMIEERHRLERTNALSERLRTAER